MWYEIKVCHPYKAMELFTKTYAAVPLPLQARPKIAGFTVPLQKPSKPAMGKSLE